MSTYVPRYRHDVFVSYAHVDNEPIMGADTRWVTNLITGLKPLLGMKLGRADAYSLWMDYGLRGNEVVTPHILEQLQESAILLLVLSPGYAASDWCRLELSSFVAKVSKREGRVFIVEREPVERPEELQDILGYKFWLKDEADSPRTLGAPKPNQDESEYYKRLDELARQIVEKLKHLRSQGGASAVTLPPLTSAAQSGTPRATVFLAEVTDDLQELRAEVERYLQQQNIHVVPSTLYYFPTADELRQAIDTDLQASTLFVQLLSAVFPRRPPGMTTPQMQHDAAQARAGLPILQWRDRKLNVAAIMDPAPRAFLESATVVAMGIEEFKQYVIQQLEAVETKRRLEEERRKREESGRRTVHAPSSKGDTLIFINTLPEDLGLAQEICAMLAEEGFGYSLPLLDDVSPEEKEQDLLDNLQGCDAVIVLYANTPAPWVRKQLLHCRRVRGQRDPLKIIAVFMKTLPGKPPLGMNLPNMQILEFSSLRESQWLSVLKQVLQP